jgi:hypothetical protein
MINRIWILGAPDPEMAAIESLLLSVGERVAHAGFLDPARPGCFRRCHAGDANAAKAHQYRVDCGDAGDSHETWCLVECTVPTPDECPVVRIDHHRPGDPGFGLSPSDFWMASSLGQVCALLGRFPAPELILIAAADHCLGAAYRGECPGVDPEVLKKFRAEERAKFQGRHVEEVMADIEATTHALRAAPSIELQIRDMRREIPWPELVEAGTIAGVSYIAGPLACPDGRKKIVCSGSADQIRAFMSDFEPSLGLVGIYGDPARGFAGGYLP